MISEIFVIIFLLILGTVLFKVLKGMIKTIMVITIVIGLIIMVFLLLFVRDANNIGNNIDSSPLLILLQNDGQIIAGFSTIGMNGSNVTFLNSSQIENVRTMYASGNREGILGDNFRYFETTLAMFDPLEETLISGEKAYTKTFLLRLLKSDDPAQVYVENQFPDMSEKNKDIIISTLGDKVGLKSQLFALLFQKIYEDKGIIYIFVQYKENHLSIYPETIALKSIKKLPTSYAKKKFQELFASAKDKVIPG